MRTVIFHIDLDSFFVSAERLRNPKLIGRPVAIGGAGARGVIASASYESRKFGVRSAMPTAQALRLCPRLVLVPPDFSHYSTLSRAVFAIAARHAPVIEQTGIDEGYLDMTGTRSLLGPPEEAAQRIRHEIRVETGLPCSIGIASNRLVAKVATDRAKPNGQLLVPEGSEAAFLAPLPVGVIPGCGPKTQAWLESRAIFRIEELQKLSAESLERSLGKFGHYLHDAAWGRGSTAFNEEAKTRSISREETFSRDESDRAALLGILWGMTEELGSQLRRDGDFARAIRLKLRYPPFETVARSRVLEAPTQLDETLYRAVERLFDEHWRPGEPLRLVGMGCVLGDGTRQLGLFEEPEAEQRQMAVDRLKDEIRKKFGEGALRTGRQDGKGLAKR